MYCQSCGSLLKDGSAICVYCGEPQKTAAPVKEPDATLRRLFEELGPEAVLSDGTTLPRALLHALPGEGQLATRLGMILEEGIGLLYLGQVYRGAPSSLFYKNVYSVMTGTLGLGDKPARELMEHLNAMVGWQNAEMPAPEPARTGTAASGTTRTAEPARPRAEAPKAARTAEPERVDAARPARGPEPAKVRRPEPMPKAAPRTAEPAAPKTSPAPPAEKKKKSAKDYTYWLLAVLFTILGIMNIQDMKEGIYMVWLGIPVQYILLPLAGLFVILGIREAVNKD